MHQSVILATLISLPPLIFFKTANVKLSSLSAFFRVQIEAIAFMARRKMAGWMLGLILYCGSIWKGGNCGGSSMLCGCARNRGEDEYDWRVQVV